MFYISNSLPNRLLHANVHSPPTHNVPPLLLLSAHPVQFSTAAQRLQLFHGRLLLSFYCYSTACCCYSTIIPFLCAILLHAAAIPLTFHYIQMHATAINSIACYTAITLLFHGMLLLLFYCYSTAMPLHARGEALLDPKALVDLPCSSMQWNDRGIEVACSGILCVVILCSPACAHACRPVDMSLGWVNLSEPLRTTTQHFVMVQRGSDEVRPSRTPV